MFSKDYTYDIECYPNVWTCVIKHLITGKYWTYEISDRRNDYHVFITMMQYLSMNNCRMIGFNNIGYDYPVIHHMFESSGYYDATDGTAMDAAAIYKESHRIISTGWNQRFSNTIRKPYIIQLDLLKINHFDNVSRLMSLKGLEFNMRSENIQDLPFVPGSFISPLDIPDLLIYNAHDVDETEKFFFHCAKAIKFRAELSKKFSKDFMNHNDTKIGKDYLIMKLEEDMPGSCYDNRKPRQTIRPYIDLKDVIFPYVKFNHPEFNRILDYFNSQRITETKGVFKDLNCVVDDFKFVFGLGGIHGSVESQTVIADEDGVLLDWDVKSYYPNLSIKNKLYPEHLSEQFCKIYEEVYEERKKYKKGTPENLAYKLALNGSYGDSNSKYSPFFDSKFTMSITVNGQLLLCMLAEKLMLIPGLKLLQINTDGLSMKCPHNHVELVRIYCKQWEEITKLELEENQYNRMFIRDVNNYIAEYPGGKLKRKGAYEYDRNWSQNHSAMVVPRAAEAHLVHGQNIKLFITGHKNIYDFMLRTKLQRTSHLLLDEVQIQNTSRYYISTNGGTLIKVMPPLKKNPEKWRRMGIAVGWKATECNNIYDADWSTINYEYYINETNKLVEKLL